MDDEVRLGAEDLRRERSSIEGKRARHDRSLHGSGAIDPAIQALLSPGVFVTELPAVPPPLSAASPDDPEWKYVSIRRLALFVESSLEEGLGWVVFEPNTEPLWTTVREAVGIFLTDLWRGGSFRGEKPEDAFFVRCDRTTMSQNDIDDGRLIVVVGFAPLRPAEFVILRVGLWTADRTDDDPED